MTSGVARTLYTGFRAESLTPKGFCETGWLLWGHRRPNEVLVTAVVGAGPGAKRWENSIEFDKKYQHQKGEELQKKYPSLKVLGICHTHPYRCVRPSGEDYSADSSWVGLLTGGEGVFGIGVEGKGDIRVGVMRRDDMEFHWYALSERDVDYRRVPVAMIRGEDVGSS